MLINTTEGRQAIRDSYDAAPRGADGEAALLHHAARRAGRGAGAGAGFARVSLKWRRCNRILQASH